MITGQFINGDGGVHPVAVAIAKKMAVDLQAKKNVLTVAVFHDLAASQAKQPRPIVSRSYTLAGAQFATDPAAVDVFLLSQPAYTGWTDVPASAIPPATPAKK
ncbi:MAG TPA: hypothetical protein VHX65_16915 [Pirellulales bacterium]|jgi:hypothetical protein|nr:hypothetical protein [Pirellulales bacterium]